MKLRREPRDVEVLVARAGAQILEVPDELGQHPGHVAGVQDGLVVLGADAARHQLGVGALVSGHLERRGVRDVEADGESVDVRYVVGRQA